MALYTIPMWLFLILFPLLLVLLLKKIQSLKILNKRLPPSPPKLPVLGNLHQLGELPHQSLRLLSNKYGPVMLLKLGRIPLTVISSAQAARDVLKNHDLDCCSRPPLTGTRKLTYNYLDMAFSPYSEHWREIRKICVLELFSLKRTQSFQFIREEETAFLINSISESSSSSSSVDLSEKLFALTGSIVFRMAFGKRFRGSKFDNHRFEELVHAAESVLGGFTANECFPYIGWIIDRLTSYHAKLERVFHELDTLFQQIIDDHLKPERSKQEVQEDFIDVMLKIEREETESRLSKDHIKAVLLNMFLGGVDTSAITVIWAMAELAKNPRLMHKAQDEVRKCIGQKGRVTESDIDKLVYLKMIIKETLRLHPPAPLLIPREAISQFNVNGYNIYPKTLIQVNAWAIGRDPKYWNNPEEFSPERFMNNSIDLKGQNFEFLPFGSGRRSCPAMHMGLITSELALANLLYCFDWKLPNGMKEDDLNMDESAGVSLTVSKKIPLILVPVNYLQQP
ncbi:cytochrome P450 71B10-like [Pistacia vera]|uniref:cytochrome P450 71B10-like n=1 Tax=Pistacia vera TaxID=55513 RepID=UPI0012631595|nr:cytochrome P450 71B10-like [Pistacia vera]